MKKFYLFFFLSINFLFAAAQNYWTGTDNNDLWNSSGNWTGGVPINTDVVIIDNLHGALGSFSIEMPNTSVTVVSITISPDLGNNITIALPATNTTQPGLILNGPGDVLVIHNGGIFKNAWGGAGMSINFVNATDSIKVNNGGKYLHNNIAMHAYIVARLSTDLGTEKGIFEYDIPGGAPGISIAGRTYGSLMLTAVAAGGTKLYNGLGATDLIIKGDLIINTGATFSPSLTSNINIAGDLNIIGDFIFNPQTGMGIKRSIIFNGTANQNITGNGAFTLGTNFKAILIQSNANVFLQRDIDLPTPFIDFIVNTNAALYAGTHLIKGEGRFIQDINGLLGIGSPDGITLAPTLLGNIQTSNRMYALGSFEYNGNTPQVTGNGLDIIYDLIINNSANETVTLTKNITINSSGTLSLQKGFLKTSSLALPTLSANGIFSTNIISPNSNYFNCCGITNIGWEKSFIDGPLNIQVGSTTKKWVPVGKITPTDTLFGPVAINKFNTALATYSAEYFPEAHSDFDNVDFPLDHVSGLEFWNIECDVITNPDRDAKITLSWRPYSKVGNGNPIDDVIALEDLRVAHYFDDGISTKWRLDGMNPTFAIMGTPSEYGLINTNLYVTKFSPFTLGTISTFNILPVRMLEFSGEKIEKNIALQWNTTQEKNILSYEIEKSTNAISFNKIGAVIAKNNISNTYNFLDENPVGGWNYYRLKIINAQNKNGGYSKIIKVKSTENISIDVYPNPVSKELIVKLPIINSVYTICIINTNGQQVAKYISKNSNVKMNVANLSTGIYFIKITDGTRVYSKKFVKE